MELEALTDDHLKEIHEHGYLHSSLKDISVCMDIRLTDLEQVIDDSEHAFTRAYNKGLMEWKIKYKKLLWSYSESGSTQAMDLAKQFMDALTIERA